MKSILIIEDEPTIADSLVFVLRQEGFHVSWVNLGEQGIAQLQHNTFDFVVLDVGLPDISGFEICKKIRKFSDVPILFLTARSEEIDRIVGLEIGADDYVVKPFSPREIAARVKTILKRVAPRPESSPNSASVDDNFFIDSAKNQIMFMGQMIAFTPLEYRLMCTLMEAPDRVLSRDQLLDSLGISHQAGYDRSIDTHIKSIRAKLKPFVGDYEPIQTQRGFGYFFQTRKKPCP